MTRASLHRLPVVANSGRFSGDGDRMGESPCLTLAKPPAFGVALQRDRVTL